MPRRSAQAHVCAVTKGKALTIRAPSLLPAPPAPAAGAAPVLMAATIATQPSHGKVTLKAGRQLHLHAGQGSYAGTDSFTYTVTSGAATSTPATVTLVIR